MKAPYILVVDDEPDIRELVKEILEDEGYDVGVAENGAAARQALQKRHPDLVLLDIWMPDEDGITLLKAWKISEQYAFPVIMMSGHGTVETAVEATRFGAHDFVEKPLSLAKLLLTVEKALESGHAVIDEVPSALPAPTADVLVGNSGLMESLREQIKRAAASDAPLLVSGEFGVGKRALIHNVHAQSSRSAGPLLEINLSRLAHDQEGLEIFGQERDGRVTPGALERARGGGLLLDELVQMSPKLQSQLLGVLENGLFTRIGGIEPIRLDLRLYVACGQDLEALVAQGSFKAELYHRLNVLSIWVAPLREHREDIPELLEHFVNHFVESEKLAYRHFNVAAQNLLRNHPWQGNIRELRNLVQRVMILGSGVDIGVEEVKRILGAAKMPVGSSSPQAMSLPLDLPLRKARAEFERIYLEYQLHAVGGSVGELAKRVGMERTHLYRKLRSLGIEHLKGRS